MLNIIDLEQRWIRYKIKSYAPYAIAGFTLCSITILGIIFYNPQVTTKKIKVPITLETTTVAIKTVPIRKNRQKITPHIIALRPALSFMKNIEHSSQPYYETEKKEIIEVKKVAIEKKEPKHRQIAPKKNIIEEVVLPPKIDIPPQAKKLHIVKRKNTLKDINEIIQRFKKNNNPALSLFVAKKQYELKNYNQAYNYALITNKLDNNIDESWIIFAKSLVKLHKKEQAISTLQKYIKYSHSSNAQILLNEILSGLFQ